MKGYVYGTSALKDDTIIVFPGSNNVVEQPEKKKGNYKVGEKQEVYPFRSKEDLQSMHNYFVEHKSYRDDCMFIFGINVGLRAGDLLALSWGDVFPESREEVANSVVVKEEKTDKWRTFYLNESCKNAIKNYYPKYVAKYGIPADDEYIFKSQKGGMVTVRAAGKILKIAATEVGIKYNVGTHSMRKTFGYWQLKAHANDALFLCQLQEMFNHSSPKITLRYCGLEEERMEQYYNDVNLL